MSPGVGTASRVPQRGKNGFELGHVDNVVPEWREGRKEPTAE